MRRGGTIWAVFALAAVLGGLVSRAARADDEASAKVREALVRAAEKKDPRAIAKALDEANALVGAAATFPDGGDLADWLGTLPEQVSKLSDVQLRRGWLYVVAQRAEDAKGALERVLAVDAGNATARAYLAQARRLLGDLDGAVSDLLRAVADGASDAHVLPEMRWIVIRLHEKAPPVEDGALPAYAAAAKRFLAVRRLDDVDRAVADWLDFDANAARDTPKKAALLRAEAVRRAWSWVQKGEAAESVARARRAVEAAGWVKALGADRPADVPERFDLLAAAVRLGETQETDGPQVPEALSALAEEALVRGRFALAASLARKRLAVSDSPAARRVLLACPPDVGD